MILLWVIVTILMCFGFVVLFGAPYVPTLNKELQQAFDELYKLDDQDVVVDLGSGDGRVLREAAKRGARGFGYELNPLLVVFSKLRLRTVATIRMQDMWRVTLPAATTLVYVFTVSRDGRRVSKYVQSQADKQRRSFHVMTFGPQLKDRQPVAILRGHSLYEIRPMQRRSA